MIQIQIWNRRTNQIEIEQVYGEAALSWVYGNMLGQWMANRLLSKPPLSQAYGAYQSSRLSQHKIQPFIEAFHIPMEEYVDGPFLTFNDFFIRHFKAGKRPFVTEASQFPAFAEARYFAFEKVRSSDQVPVKGLNLSPAQLLGNVKRARPFEGGPLLLARLCPTDYHRFHFPDSGRMVDEYRLHGSLHSVNPLALEYKSDILISNERHVSFLETENFGTLAYVEVGALCVGKIVQSHIGPLFKRGDEKGYFLFGGSTVIVLGQPGRWKPSADLIEQTLQGRECLVRLGESVGQAF